MWLYIAMEANEISHTDTIETAQLERGKEDNISRTITVYASQALRTIALCYRDFKHWPPKGVQLVDDGR